MSCPMRIFVAVLQGTVSVPRRAGGRGGGGGQEMRGCFVGQGQIDQVPIKRPLNTYICSLVESVGSESQTILVDLYGYVPRTFCRGRRGVQSLQNICPLRTAEELWSERVSEMIGIYAPPFIL